MNSFVLLFVLVAACLMTGQAFLLNINRRQALQSVPFDLNYDLTENIRCVTQAIETCPEFADPRRPMTGRDSGVRQPGDNLVVGNRLIINCRRCTLEDNRDCLARARGGCENHSKWVDALVGLQEDLCAHEQELVSNAACLESDGLSEGLDDCFREVKEPSQLCLVAGRCLRTAAASLPGCPEEGADLLYRLAKNTTDIAFGADCERFPDLSSIF